MTSRKDLEDQIAAKLVSLSNEDAQRIAEEYVRIRYAERFPYFGFRAFSPEGKSRSGWPDASSIGADGKIEGVEATHTASRAGVVGHLEEYLEKAKGLKPDKLGGFLHVSVSPKASFLPDEIKDWTDKFVEAGFARDRVELIFGQGLVEILTRPEFARSRIEILGIQDLPTHFRLYRSKIGPDERRLGLSFIPNWEDFESGRIHRPDATKTAAERLDRDRVALVRGIGASGKTVMAWLLAQDVVQRGLPAYCFDFADYPILTTDVVNALIGDLKRFAHRDVLFVLDNIHLDETSAKELFLAWQEIPPSQQPRLLLVGRETRTAKGSALTNLKLDALPLRARQAELRGVFRRLALRDHSGDWLAEPPEAELTNWLRTFGGNPGKAETTADLIVFSAAVARRMRDLCRGRWQLTQKDAVEQVQEVYLSKLSPPEQQNLIRLCIAEKFELGVQTEALADKKAALTTCNAKLGIVFRDEVGAIKRYVRYRLVHAALGELLLSALEISIDRHVLFREMTLVSPLLGNFATRRMMREGQLEDARAVAAGLIARPDSLLLFDSYNHFQETLRLTQRLGIELPEGFGDTLANQGKNRLRLVDIALQTPLHDLASFLRYAEAVLRPVFSTLQTELATETNRVRLVDIALRTPLGDLANFLRYAEAALRPVFSALQTELADPKNRPNLVEIALRTPLGDLVSFLRYAEKSLRPVFSALQTELATETNRARFTDIALRTPLGDLANFLRYAEAALRPVFSALQTELATETNRARFTDIALRTPLGDLANFLRYAEKSLPPIFAALQTELADPKNRPNLVENALQTPLHFLVSFLRYAEKSLRPVFSALQTELATETNRARFTDIALRTPLGDLANFLRYAEAALRPVFSALQTELADPKNRPNLVENALQTPLHFLVSFLRYAETSLEPVFDTLKTELAEPQSLSRLVHSALNARQIYVTGFLRYAETSLPIVYKQLLTELQLRKHSEEVAIERGLST